MSMLPRYFARRMKQDMHKPEFRLYALSLGAAWFVIGYLPSRNVTEESKTNSVYFRRYNAGYREKYEEQEKKKWADKIAAAKALRDAPRDADDDDEEIVAATSAHH